MSRSLFLVAFAALATAPPFAARAEGEGPEDLARRALENNMFSTSNARAEVHLEVMRDGKVVRERRITTKIKRKDGVVRSFVEFREPADVAGTRFLSVENKKEEAEQFIYLPAFKKVKRVVGSQRSKSFMGTDFSYDDLDGRDVEEATWQRMPDKDVGGIPCYVIEGRPRDPGARLNERSVLWVHKEHHIPMRIDFYGAASTEANKRFTVQRLEKRSGRWLATESVMATPKKGTQTRLKLLQIDFDSEIPDAELTRQALER